MLPFKGQRSANGTPDHPRSRTGWTGRPPEEEHSRSCFSATRRPLNEHPERTETRSRPATHPWRAHRPGKLFLAVARAQT